MLSLPQILRHFKRHSFQTTLIISGMLLAMVTSLLIKGWIDYQQSYDSHYPEDIYRVTIAYRSDNGIQQWWARVNVGWINELPAAIPEVKQLIRFQSFRPRNVIVGESKFKEEYAYSVDSEIFEMFDLKFIEGNNTALNGPQSVVLTEATAIKYFGNSQAAMHQQMILDSPPNQQEYVVTGVIANPPKNTHLPITLLSRINRPEDRLGWAYVYLKIKNPENLSNIHSSVDAFIAAHHDSEEVSVSLDFMPIKDIYMHSHASREIISPGQPKVIRIFSWVLGLLILIGASNFVLFNSTKMLSRHKSLNLRKILGASSRSLKAQMLLEALVILTVTFVLAVGLFYILLPFTETFFSTSFRFDLPLIFTIGGWFCLSSLVGIGLYLWLFTSLRPELKPKELLQMRSFGVREALLATQFALTFGILTSFLFINHQLDFMLSSTNGLNTNQVLALTNFHTEVSDELAAYQQDISHIAGIRASAGLMQLPSTAIQDVGRVTLTGVYTDQNGPMMDVQVIDESYFDVLEVPFITGNIFPDHLLKQQVNKVTLGNQEILSFMEQINAKRQAYIINESAARKLGFIDPEDAIQQQITWSNGAINLQPGPIVGVVADYHQEGFAQEIDPTVFIYEPMLFQNLLVKIESASPTQMINQLEAAWNIRFTELPFEYTFLDHEYEQLYAQEQSARNLFSAFTMVAMLILITGLIGVLSFELQRKLKVLAIRKVLGAHFWNLMIWISKPYWKMIAGSFLVVVPICYLLLQDWISSYAYRATPDLSIWLIPVITESVLLLVVCGFIVRRFSLINPADVLRSE